MMSHKQGDGVSDLLTELHKALECNREGRVQKNVSYIIY